MDFNTYQTATDTTAIYTHAGQGDTVAVNYAILGLIGEAGEIANKWKKHYRDGISLDELYPVIASELGDVLWYAARLALEMGYSFSMVAEENLQKLQYRKQREVLTGSGDDR
jgi:NTP pyrophosphatase (non-canonical NTP hydrolase)